MFEKPGRFIGRRYSHGNANNLHIVRKRAHVHRESKGKIYQVFYTLRVITYRPIIIVLIYVLVAYFARIQTL